jgi:RHS repeat-associated protein
MGRVHQEVSPDTGTTTYQCDPEGNQISKTDARGITVLYSYDALNRLTLVDFPTETDIVYTYDTCTNGKGRVCQVVDQAGTTTYTYSPKGELVQEDKLILGVNYATAYQYDDNGNIEVLTYPSGRTVTYVYDNADQVNTVLTTAPGSAQQTVASSISYYPFGEVGSLTYGNSLIRTVGYDLQYRLTGIQTGSVQDLTYIPDPNGNISDIVDNLESNKNKSFSHDALNRLEIASGPWGSLSWTYDNVGNRLTYTDGAGTTNYNYFTGTNRLESLTGAEAVNYTHGPNGSIATEGSREYLYNENGRLEQVVDGNVLGTYAHDADGHRVVKTSGSATTVFNYDLKELLMGEFLSNGMPAAEYIYLNGRPVAKAVGDVLEFIHNDHMATAAIMTNQSGASVWAMEAQPFGEGAQIFGTGELNLRFPGQYYDEETNLHQNYFRDYAPNLGRYIEPDPLGLFGGGDLYSYAKGNPLILTDATGLQAGGTEGLPWNRLPPPPSNVRDYENRARMAAKVFCKAADYPDVFHYSEHRTPSSFPAGETSVFKIDFGHHGDYNDSVRRWIRRNYRDWCRSNNSENQECYGDCTDSVPFGARMQWYCVCCCRCKKS